MIHTHDDEPPVASPTGAQTDAALKDMKVKNPSGMSALSGALGKLASSLAASITAEASNATKLAINKATLGAIPASSLPTVKLPDVGDAIKSIGSAFKGTSTPDTEKVHKASQNANTQSDPGNIGKFSGKMVNQVSVDSDKRVTELTNSLADVNGMKNAVDRA